MRTTSQIFFAFTLLLAITCLTITDADAQNCNANFTFVVNDCNEVIFTAVNAPGQSYTWDFGDGSSGSGATVTHTYISFGNGTDSFSPELTVTGPNCSNTNTETVIVDQVPDPSISDVSGDNFLSCDSPFLFIEGNSSTAATNINYSITFANGAPATYNGSSLPQTQVTFPTGTHQIVVTVTGANGCTNSRTYNFVFSAQPNIGSELTSQDPVCIPGSVEFSISGVSNNTSNTIYIVETDYGTAPQTYNHPPPSIINLPIDTSSCGNISIINGQEFQDAFQISVTAETGCPNQNAASAAGPVRTITAPQADFDILPDTEACPNDLIEFINTSTSGLFFNAAANDCIDRLAVLWDITPNTGYTIQSGSLQDSAGFTATFSEPGSYNINLAIANKVFVNPINPFTSPFGADPYCGVDSLSKNICILPNPESNFNSNYNQSCFPTIIQPTNTSNTVDFECGTTEYTWIVNFLMSECGNVGGHSFINGTTANSVDPEIRFDSSGLYQVMLIVENVCGLDTSDQEIEVASSPFTQINPIPDSCFYGTTTIQPSLAVSAGCYATPTYEWSFPGGTPNSFSGSNPPPISYNSFGNYSIMVTTMNDCGTSTTSRSFNLFEPPSVPDITYSAELCVGEDLVFINNNSGGLQYSWTGPNSFTSTSPNPTIPNATEINSGVYTVVVTDPDTECTDTQSYTVDIGANASLIVTPNPDTICIGQTATLTASGASNYLWSPPDFLSSTTSATVMVTPPNVGTYTYTVMGNDQTVDCNGMATVDVVVIPEPVVSAGANQITCINTNLQLMGTPVATGSAQSSWSGTHVNSAGLFNSPETGTFTLTYLYSGFGCEDMAEVDVCVTEVPTADFSIDSIFGCGTLSVPTTNLSNVLGSCDTPIFEWSATFNGAECHSGTGQWSFSSGGADSENPIFLFSQEGVYDIHLTVTNSCSESTTTQTITVGGPPQVQLDPISNGCDASAITPTFVYSDCNSDNIQYTFIADGGTPSISTGLPAPEITYSAPGNYTVYLEVTTDCGTAIDSSLFQILEGPTLDVTVDTTLGCPGSVITVFNNSTGDDLISTLDVVGPGSFNIDAADPTEFMVTFLGAGSYTLTLAVLNPECEPLTWTETITIFPEPILSITAYEDFCGTAMITPVATTNVEDNEILSILWSFPNGQPTTSSNLDPGVITYNSAGTYTYSATITTLCGTVTAEESFQVLEAPEINVDIDTTLVCQGESIVVTNTSTGDELAYSWMSSGPGTVLINPDNVAEPSITFPDTGTYVLTLTISNPVCDALIWTSTVSVFTEPEISLDTFPDFCNSAIINPIAQLNVGLNQVDSIRWLFPGGQPQTSTALNPGSITYNSPNLNNVVTLMIFNRCGSDTLSESFAIFQPIDVNTSLSNDFSCDLPFTVEVTNQTTGDGLNFKWTAEGPNPSQVNFIPNNMVAEPDIIFQDTGVYTITQTIFNPVCDSIIWQDEVRIFAPPAMDLTPVDSFCQSIALTPAISYGTSRIDSVLWNFPDATPPQSTDLFPSNIQYNGAGTYIYSLTAFNICGMTTIMDTFVIDTLPPIILGPTDTICIDDGPFQVPAPSPLGGLWFDSIGQPGVITTGGLFDPVEAGGGPRTIEYFYTVGACEISTYKEIFVVDLDSVDAGPDQFACISDTLVIIDSGFPSGGWYVGPGIQDSLLGSFNPSSLSTGDYVIHYFYQLPNTECIGTDSFTMTIHPLPIPAIGVTDSICVNVPVDISSSGSGAVDYLWNINNNLYTTPNISHIFLDTGFQMIHLTVTSAFGCLDSISRTVYVAGPPIAIFAKDTTMGCAILPVNFFNESFEFATGSQYLWDFGNGMTSNEANPPTIFYDQGLEDTTYYVQMTATNYCGSDEYLDSILVFPLPLTKLIANQIEGCEPLPVAFNNGTRGLPTSFFWDMGNGNTYTDSIPPNQVYYADDSSNVIYTVMLIAFNECGSDTSFQDILVKPNTVRAFFSVDPNTGCEPFTINFQNSTSPDTALNYNWTFGDGETSIEKNPSHTFYPQGDSTTVYQVMLTADNGCSFDTMTLPITVHPAPEISFTSSPVDPCFGDTIQFTNTSTGVFNPIWNMGDGTLIEANNPTYVYNTPGSFTVTLTAFAENTGCPGVDSSEVFIEPIPTAAFSANIQEGCPGLQVTFTDQSANGSFYSWDFGNGNTAAGAGPHVITYEETGFYEVLLTVRNMAGCENDTLLSGIEIYPAPTAAFSAYQVDDCGLPAQVCVEDESLGAVDYDWAFYTSPLNPTNSSENNPCVIVDSAGLITIDLTVANEFQCTDELSINLPIYDTPQAIVTPEDTIICAGMELTFTSFSLNNTFVNWSFPDGYQSTDSSFTRVFPESGDFTFTVVVGNESGCTDTLTQNILVNPSPIAAFDFQELPNELTNTFQFTDRSSSDAIAFGWDFMDVPDSDERNPVRRFISIQDQWVKHWVDNSYGCSDTISILIDLDTLTRLFIPNAFEPENRSVPEINVFQPKGIGLEDYHIAVYARNGQLVWESTVVDENGQPTEGWNGTYRGQLLGPDVFTWQVHLARFKDGKGWKGMQTQQGGRFNKTGFIYLIR